MQLTRTIKDWLDFKGSVGSILDKRLHKWLVKPTTINQLNQKGKKKVTPHESEILTPEVQNMNFFYRAKHLQQASYVLPEIYTIILQNAIYSPIYNVLLTQSRKVILDSINTQKTLKRFSVSNLYRKKIEKISGICTIFRSPSNSYYHTLIENIPRLYLLDCEESKQFNEIKLLLSSPPTPIEKYYLEKLLPNNFKIHVVNEDCLYITDRLIFPSFMTQRFSGYLPLEYLEYFWSKILPSRTRKRVHRIFISRSPDRTKAIEKTVGIGRYEQQNIGRGRYILNEEELFDKLKPYGFKKYLLENLSIEEQIELFYDADYVIAAHGAGLSNMIFSDNIQILELFPTPFVVPHYYYLAKSLRHTYKYWCGQEDQIHSNFTVNVSEVISRLGDL